MTLIDTADESIGEVTCRRLRSDVLEGILRPGDRLTLDRLRSRYAVSVGTLREILTRLASEGLVLAEGQKGFAVAPASEADLRDLGALRLLLESHALGLSLQSGDIEWEARVVAAHHRLASVERHLLSGGGNRTPEWIAYDRSFHEALIAACGSPALMATHRSVFDRFVRYHMLAESFRGRPVVDDHAELLRAALARDTETAQALLRRHVEHGISHVLGTGRIGR